MRRGGDAWNERDLRIVSDSATPINQSETAATEGGRELGSGGEGLGDFVSFPPLTASAASDQTPRPQSFDTTSANVVVVCHGATFSARHHSILTFVTFDSKIQI